MQSNTYPTSAFTIETIEHLNAILRLPLVLKARGVSRSQHYLDIKNGLYTRAVPIGDKAVGWPASEVAVQNSARIAGKTKDEIRAVVRKLMAARAALA